MTVRITDVVDTRIRAPEEGRQQQTIDAAEKAQAAIDGCRCVVLLSFIPDADKPGGFIVEVGVGGSGPKGFGKIVGQTMRGVAGTLESAMTRQERERGPSS